MNGSGNRRITFTSNGPYRSFTSDSENPSFYRPGGFHPVALGQVYESAGARYKIIHKLGYGSYATVWLASVLDERGQSLW